MPLTAGQFETLNIVGVIIGRTAVDQNHVGLLYYSDEGVRVLHLAWHYRLQNDDPAHEDFQKYLWADFNLVDPENRSALAAFAENVWMTRTNIPYGFTFDGSAFNVDGTFVPPPLGQGLTCVSFLLHVLGGAGFSLLDMSSWQNRDDDGEWRQKIIGWFERTYNVPAGHIDLLRQDTNALRVRPEDVVGAALSSPWPVNFEDSSAAGREILRELLDTIEFTPGSRE